MTPQEKLAALAEKWRKNARELGRNGDPNGAWNDTLNCCADELTTLLSEQPEVVITTDESGRCVAVTRQDSEGRILSTIWEASEHGGGGEAWRPIDTAPRDGTMLRLLVQFDDHATEDCEGPAPTIGAWQGADGEDDDGEWLFAGWCWTHDHFTQGKGTPVGWLPMLTTTPPTPPTPSAPVVDYTDIANRAQEATGRSIWPSTVKAVLEAAALSGVSAPVGVDEALAKAVADIETMIRLRGSRSPSIAQMRAWAAALTGQEGAE